MIFKIIEFIEIFNCIEKVSAGTLTRIRKSIAKPNAHECIHLKSFFFFFRTSKTVVARIAVAQFNTLQSLETLLAGKIGASLSMRTMWPTFWNYWSYCCTLNWCEVWCSRNLLVHYKFSRINLTTTTSVHGRIKSTFFTDELNKNINSD